MSERLFNVFIYGNETHVHSMGYCELELPRFDGHLSA